MSSIDYETQNDVVTMSEEEEQTRREVELTKRERKFNNNIAIKQEVHIGKKELGLLLPEKQNGDRFTNNYKNKKGDELSFEVDESDALYYLMYDQPDEPQITASARSSKSGRPRVSDEA